MPFVEANGIQLYYELHGEGPRLLVFLGSGSDLRQKPGIFATPLTRHFEVLAFDQRGQGQSDAPDIPYTMADYAADGLALLEALGWERCGVLGISFGGMVAQEFALLAPERVERLVLACTSSGGQGGASAPLEELDGQESEAQIQALIPMFDVRLRGDWLEPKVRPRRGKDFLAAMLQRLAPEQVDEKLRVGKARQLEARKGHDTYARLPEITAPTLVCGGHFDGIAPPSNLYQLQRQIPGADIQFFNGGHLFFVEDPRAFPAIIDFLLDREDPTERAYARAMAVYREDHLATARELLGELLKSAPEHAEALLFRGEACRLLQDDCAEAYVHWRQILEAHPHSPMARLAQSLLHYYEDEEDASLQQLDEALEMEPDFVLGLFYRAELHSELGEYDLAIRDATRAIELKPGWFPAYYIRASDLSKKGDHEQALANCDEATRLNPRYQEVYVLRAEIYEQMGLPQQAIIEYTTALEICPSDEFALAGRGKLLQHTGQVEDAMTDFDQALEKDPENVDAYIGRGDAYFQKGELDKAISDYSEALDRDSGRWKVYYKRGCARHQKGELDPAISDYSEALYREYNAVDALNNRGLAYQSKGMIDSAISDFGDAIGRRSEDAIAYNNRGAAYMFKCNYYSAIYDFNEAIRIKPDDPDFYFNRANARQENKEFSEAIEDLEKVVELKQEKEDEAGVQEAQDFIKAIRERIAAKEAAEKKAAEEAAAEEKSSESSESSE